MKNWIALTGLAAPLLGACASRHSHEGAASAPAGPPASGQGLDSAGSSSGASPEAVPNPRQGAGSNQDFNIRPGPVEGPKQPNSTEDSDDSKPELVLPHNRDQALSI